MSHIILRSGEYVQIRYRCYRIIYQLPSAPGLNRISTPRFVFTNVVGFFRDTQHSSGQGRAKNILPTSTVGDARNDTLRIPSNALPRAAHSNLS